METIIEPVDKALLKEELLLAQEIAEAAWGDIQVYCIDSSFPHLLREVGRLREIAFRGRACDLDAFDTDPAFRMKQLVAWDAEDECITGGYRYVNGYDMLMDSSGQPRIPAAHLFRFSERFMKEEMPHTMELSRSFIVELFAHGGMSILPYRTRLKELFPSGKIHLIENYNASDGFFGIQTDLSDPAMTLMLDYGNFYEFVPMSTYGKPGAKAVLLWEIELGVDYAILVSTCSGLWRYDMGDVVRFTRRSPYRFVMVGRTHQNISIWGEDLSVQQAEKALERACRLCGASVREFTVAPVSDSGSPTGHHQRLVEFERAPEDMEGFAATLDRMVQAENLDYEDFRQRYYNNALEVVQAPPGLFYEWLEAKGKLGGQHKIPRLCSSRKYMDELLGRLSGKTTVIS